MQELCDEVPNPIEESESGKMSELEQLKADLATLESAAKVLGMRPKTYEQIEAEVILNEQRIAALEAELSKRPVLEAADALLQEMERHKAATADYLREKLAELITILNAIPPACPEARDLVQARIYCVKKEMQGNE